MILEGRSLQFDMIYVYGEKNGRGGNGEIIRVWQIEVEAHHSI